MDYYEILGIPRDATIEDIRRAYRRSAQRLHPDKNVRPGDTQLFLEATQAYDVLSDPLRRARYDSELEATVAKAPSHAQVHVRFVHGRNSLLVLGEPQMHYMLLEVLPPDRTSIPHAPINLCVMIDHSTSMRGERMDRVRRATVSILKSLSSDDSASVIAFCDRAEVVVSPEQARKLNVARARLSQIQAGGGTEIARALEAGLAQVRSRSTKGSVNHLILITDGRTYGDEQACKDIATQAGAEWTTINTIGIGAEWSDALLDEVARLSGGNAIYMDSPRALSDLMERIHHSLSHIAALQVLVEADIAEKATLRSAFRLRPDPLPLGDTFPMSLGHLPSDDGISVLLEWMLDPIANPGQFEFAEFHVSSGGIGSEEDAPQLTATARVPVYEKRDSDHPDQDVLSAVGALTLYRMQERARLEASSGQTVQAMQRLENLAKHLKMIGEEKLARRALSEASTLKQTRRLSSEGEKALKYETRALLLLPHPVKR